MCVFLLISSQLLVTRRTLILRATRLLSSAAVENVVLGRCCQVLPNKSVTHPIEWDGLASRRRPDTDQPQSRKRLRCKRMYRYRGVRGQLHALRVTVKRRSASSVLLPPQGNRLKHWRGHHHPALAGGSLQEQRRKYWGKSFWWIRTNSHWTQYIQGGHASCSTPGRRRCYAAIPSRSSSRRRWLRKSCGHSA